MLMMACPHCGTRYRVSPEATGGQDRQFACAHCGAASKVSVPMPGDGLPLDSEAERALDAAFEAAELAHRTPDSELVRSPPTSIGVGAASVSPAATPQATGS